MTAAVDGAISDRASATFGIRSVSSHLTPQGYHQFVINGKPVLIRGAGWAPDMFLRDDPKRMEAEFSYVVNLGLNTIRSEGKLEDAALLRSRGPRRHHDPARLGVLRQVGIVGQDGRRAVGCGGREGGCRLDGERGASAAKPPVGDRISDRQRQCAASGDLEDVCRYLACRRLAAADHRGGGDQATAETGPSGMKMAGPYCGFRRPIGMPISWAARSGSTPK